MIRAGEVAPEGQVWVCRCCGKTEKDLFGADNGWDEACVINAKLCYEDKLVFDEEGLVSEVLEDGYVDGDPDEIDPDEGLSTLLEEMDEIIGVIEGENSALAVDRDFRRNPSEDEEFYADEDKVAG